MSMPSVLDLGSFWPLVEGRHENPFAILGPHEVSQPGGPALAVRAYLPGSAQVWVVDPAQGRALPMRKIHQEGLFEAICPMLDKDLQTQYRLRVEDVNGRQTERHDPYAFPPLLGELDLHLLGEGTHWRCYDKLGAHPATIAIGMANRTTRLPCAGGTYARIMK